MLVLAVEDVGVANIIGARRLLISQDALPELVARANGTSEDGEKWNGRDSRHHPSGRLPRKTYVLAELGKYTFQPDTAYKTQIRQAIEQLFGVQSLSQSAPRR